MTVIGQASSYDLTVGQKISIDEAIYMLSPMDAPLLTGKDSDGLSVLSSAPVTEVEHTWQQEEIKTPRSSLAASIATTTASFVVLPSGERTKFSTGDVLHIRTAGGASESVRVTGYATTADTLDVTRGFAGSTAGTHATGAIVLGLGTSLPEGSDPEDPRYLDRTTAVNCTQIFGPEQVDMTGTQRVLKRYGIPDQFGHELFKLNEEIGIKREQALVYGRYYNSSTTKVRTHGGLDYYITTNVNSASTELTIPNIVALQQSMYDRGGIADRLMTNPKSLSDLNDVMNTDRVRTGPNDTGRGRAPVMWIDTEFGRITIVRNRWVVPTDAFMFNREQAIVRTLRPLTLEKLAKTGDHDQVMVVGEFSFTFKGQQHAAKMTNLTKYAAA